jgi:hypothetical protein
MFCEFLKLWKLCFGSPRKKMQIPEILEKLFCAISNRTEILWWSRNSGPGFFDPTKLLWTFRKFWTGCFIA